MAEESPLDTGEQTLTIREVLKLRDFRLLWLAQIVSDFGDSLTTLALLILVNQLTGSTAALATMAIVLAVPQVTFGLVAGVYVDRLDRKRIMIVSDLLRGMLVLGFTLVGSRDQLWLLYLIAFVQATIGTFFTPARGALTPQLVPSTGLLAANSLAQTSRIIFGLLGTAAAGVLIGALGVFWPAFMLDALSFFISAVLVGRIAALSRSGAPDSPGDARSILRQLGAGLKLILHTRVLLGILVVAGVMMLGLGAVNVLFVPLMINELQVPATWFGALELAQTAGMVLSGGLVALLAARFKPTWIVCAGAMALGIAIGLIALATNIWQILVMLFVVGAFVTPLQASIATLSQTSVADEVRGRIGASLNALITTASLISMALAGVLGDLIGVRSVFVVAGGISVCAGLAAAAVF
ncbi:MAG TPA: MFS transporter, partial [Roseiflexaceae bacterium]|nr:MFS transporter [Roseiflexaceae bacterium]